MNNTLISDYFRRFQYIQFQERINNLDFPIELRYNHNHDQKGRFCSGGGGRMSASEKSTDTQNDLTSSQNSGIIEESRKNKHVQPINDISIRKVKALNGGAYSDEQNKIIQAKHKELLEFARNNNPNGECAFILSPEFNNQVNCVGKTSSLDFSSREAMNTLSYNRDLYVMHNHPKNSSFSANDIRFLMEHISVKTLSIVKHNGRIEQLTKSPFYNEGKAKEKLRTMFSKYVVSGKDSEIDKAIKEFINSKELFIYEKT